MKKHRAIPPGYMTVGEIAKKMGVTVRTLQYYDKEGILSPSAESEGGRRLYTYKDIVWLHQIQSMKYLGFSLEDIKSRLPSIDTPGEVSSVLIEQAKAIREKINSLKDVLESIEKLNEEVLQMDSVNWARYADIVVMLQEKIDEYWILKHLSDNAISNIRNLDMMNSQETMNEYKQLQEQIASVQASGYKPESEQSQAAAKAYWDFVVKFAGEKDELLPELIKMGTNLDESEWNNKFPFDKQFLEKALSAYFKNIGFNPFNVGK